MSERKSKNSATGIQVEHEEFLKAKPIQNPGLDWEEDKKGLHLKIPRKRTLWFRFFSKFLPLARERRVLLDEQGAFIWRLCDGEHQMREIAKKLSEKYNMRIKDAEAALDLYLLQLSKSGLVSFALPESVKKRYNRRWGRAQKRNGKTRK